MKLHKIISIGISDSQMINLSTIITACVFSVYLVLYFCFVKVIISIRLPLLRSENRVYNNF